MKYMNQHFGQSRIFGRCKIAINAQPSTDGGDIGYGEGNSDGGAAPEPGESEPGECNVGEPEPTVTELMAQIAKLQADAQKQKNALDKAMKERGELSKQLKSRMSAQEQMEAAKEEAERAKDERLAELESKLRVLDYSKRYMGVGMDEKTAGEIAAITGELSEPDKFFVALSKFVESTKKTAGEAALQDILKQNPNVKAGSGTAGKEDLAVALAQRIAKKNTPANQNGLEKWISGGKR